MRTTPLEQVVHNYVLNCVRTFLEGRQTFKWALGCLRRSGANQQAIREVVLRTKGYGDRSRWEMLAQEILTG